jgi:threonine-phosphate decarboxylase
MRVNRLQKADKDSLCSGFRTLYSDLGHGGDIYKLAEKLGIHEGKIIDFSASINPLGVSKSVLSEIKKEMKNLHNYPDTDTKRLREVLARHHGINPETILCGNGSTELIYLVPRSLRPKKILIPSPTFSEYERACRISQRSEIRSQKLKKENNFGINPDCFIQALKSCDMAFLCNPNNPTGRLLKKYEVLKIAEAAKELKCYLVVDEAFIDFCPEESVIKDVQNNPYLIVLRSMTKFYALTGLRIGYGVFPSSVIKKLKEFKEPWTVNSLAQKAGVAAMGDMTYKRQTLNLIKMEKRFLENGFKNLGIEFFPSQANFYLLKTKGTRKVHERLKLKGVIVRDCSNFIGLDNSYIRVAIRSRSNNTLLLKELQKIK